MSISHTHTLSSTSFLFRLGVWEVVGRGKEEWEGFTVFEMRVSFYFLLLSLRALGLEAWPRGHQLPESKAWRWWMIPKPQNFCLWRTAFFKEEVGECELVISFRVLPNKVQSKKKKYPIWVILCIFQYRLYITLEYIPEKKMWFHQKPISCSPGK